MFIMKGHFLTLYLTQIFNLKKSPLLSPFFHALLNFKRGGNGPFCYQNFSFSLYQSFSEFRHLTKIDREKDTNVLHKIPTYYTTYKVNNIFGTFIRRQNSRGVY